MIKVIINIKGTIALVREFGTGNDFKVNPGSGSVYLDLDQYISEEGQREQRPKHCDKRWETIVRVV